jgi:hypothetical protein
MTSRANKSRKKEALETIDSLAVFRDEWKPSYLISSPSYELFTKECGVEEVSYEENNHYLFVGITGLNPPTIDPNYQSMWSDGELVKESEKRRIALRVADAYTDWVDGMCPLILWKN